MVNYRELVIRRGNKEYTTKILTFYSSGLTPFEYIKYVTAKLLLLLREAGIEKVSLDELKAHVVTVLKQLDHGHFSFTRAQVAHAIRSILHELGVARREGRLVKKLAFYVDADKLREFIARVEGGKQQS